MKILVLSDSHSALRLMRQSIDRIKPNAVVHLGDYYDDCEALVSEYPKMYFYQVPGNCDGSCGIVGKPQILVSKVCGVRLYMTHGHLHSVKRGPDALIRAATEKQVQAVLFGHTHSPFCDRTEDGLWVLNPGSCCSDSGSVGLITAEGGQITDCRILRQSDLEEFT